MNTLAPDTRRCRGLRDDDAVLPLRECQTCLRWIYAGEPKRCFYLEPHHSDLSVTNGRIACAQKLPVGG